MNGVIISIGADELKGYIVSAVREALGELPVKPAAPSGTVSFKDITAKYGMSRQTALRWMKEGRFPSPVNSGTVEYRFDAAAVDEAIMNCEREFRIRPDKRRGNR